MISQRADYTFKHNRSLGRHGWLRLTPAYSVKLVRELMESMAPGSNILDPFSGTATTGVVAAEHGFSSTLFEINPFLVWFGNTKLSTISESEAHSVRQALNKIIAKTSSIKLDSPWIPPLKHIERWWSVDTLRVLALLRHSIASTVGNPTEAGVYSLLWIAFARVAIEYSAAAFNHVSVSFKDNTQSHSMPEILLAFETLTEIIITDASKPLAGIGKVVLHNSVLPFPQTAIFDAVVTSPPYPNRISYIRELRPYMFWLGFLSEAREAGELDWQAIGGTWGIATSRLTSWTPEHDIRMPSLNKITDCIASADGKNGELLALYVKKYFYDIDRHIAAICRLIRPGAEVHYIIGNSVFYGVHVPTTQFYEEALNGYGFGNICTHIIRKRNCNKQLFEYCTSATFGTASTAARSFQEFNHRKEEEPPKRIQLQLLEQDAQYKTNRANLCT